MADASERTSATSTESPSAFHQRDSQCEQDLKETWWEPILSDISTVVPKLQFGQFTGLSILRHLLGGGDAVTRSAFTCLLSRMIRQNAEVTTRL